MVWNDEFDYTGTQNDIRKLMFDDVDANGNPNVPKWISGNGYPNQLVTVGEKYSLLKRENIEIHDGQLFMRTKQKTGSYVDNTTGTTYTYESTAANIIANYDNDYFCIAGWDNDDGIPCDELVSGFNYGIFEIKAKLPRSFGDMSAFWFWSGYWQCGNDASQYSCDSATHGTPNNNFFPGWELDVFETEQYEEYDRFRYAPMIQANGLSSPTPCRDCGTLYNWNNSDPSKTFHTYTVAWTPEKITWFIDGNEIRSEYKDENNGIPQFKMQLILSCFNTKALDSEPFIVDYIRVYRPRSVNYNTTDKYCNGNYMGRYVWDWYGSTGRIQYENTFANTPYTANENYRKLTPAAVKVQSLFDFYGNHIVSSMVAHNVSQNDSKIYYTKRDGKLYRIINNSINFSQPSVITTGLHPYTNIAIHPDPTNGQVYWKDNNNRLKVLYWTGTNSYGIGDLDGAWQYPNDVKSGITVSAPNSKHGTRVYYISTNNNRLCYYEYCNGWFRHETPITAVAEFTISSNPQGKIFYRGLDNHVWVIWKFWDDNIPCNSSGLVSGWNYGVLDYPYSSTYADCAGHLAVTLDGSKVFYQTTANQLAYWKVQGAAERVVTNVDDVVGDIKANQMPDGRVEIFYVANNTGNPLQNKIKTYYEREAPQLNNETLWQNATLDVFSPGQGGIGYNANYTTGYYVGNEIAINRNYPTKIFAAHSQSNHTIGDKYMGAYIAATNWSPLPQTPFEECLSHDIGSIVDNGFHVGLEGKIQVFTNSEVPLLNLLEHKDSEIKTQINDNTIYPNPTLDNITIQLTQDWCNSIIQLYDTQGKRIKEKEAVCDNTTFDLATLPAGMYLIRIIKGKNSQTLKVIKQ